MPKRTAKKTTRRASKSTPKTFILVGAKSEKKVTAKELEKLRRVVGTHNSNGVYKPEKGDGNIMHTLLIGGFLTLAQQAPGLHLRLKDKILPCLMQQPQVVRIELIDTHAYPVVTGGVEIPNPVDGLLVWETLMHGAESLQKKILSMGKHTKPVKQEVKDKKFTVIRASGSCEMVAPSNGKVFTMMELQKILKHEEVIALASLNDGTICYGVSKTRVPELPMNQSATTLLKTYFEEPAPVWGDVILLDAEPLPGGVS